jgi:glutamine amidotransferase
MSTIAVIDYGMGNLHSVAKAIEHVCDDQKVIVTADSELIGNADRVVLPGVGAIRDCMAEIKRLELDKVIYEVVKEKPFLGVCVGMQALLTESEENEGTQCLGIIPGHVRFFGYNLIDPKTNVSLKVPHMGWNQVTQNHSHPLWKDIANNERFYFVHSYYVDPESDEVLVGTSHHGVTMAAAISYKNIFAVQFHPEKSQHCGLQLYHNFVNWNGKC